MIHCDVFFLLFFFCPKSLSEHAIAFQGFSDGEKLCKKRLHLKKKGLGGIKSALSAQLIENVFQMVFNQADGRKAAIGGRFFRLTRERMRQIVLQ